MSSDPSDVAPAIASPTGARRAGRARVSGERSERRLDAPEHARTLSNRSDRTARRIFASAFQAGPLGQIRRRDSSRTHRRPSTGSAVSRRASVKATCRTRGRVCSRSRITTIPAVECGGCWMTLANPRSNETNVRPSPDAAVSSRSSGAPASCSSRARTTSWPAARRMVPTESGTFSSSFTADTTTPQESGRSRRVRGRPRRPTPRE
jgi:hypothetical protein